MELCGVKLPTKLVGRVRGKITHPHRKKGGEEGGGGRGWKRNSTHAYTYIHADRHTHTPAYTHRHTGARRQTKIASLRQSKKKKKKKPSKKIK